MNYSGINWTELSWNPITGCTKISEGCKHCYAETMAKRLHAMHQKHYKNEFKLTLHPDTLGDPLKRKKPAKIFVCSMSDIFHKDVPYEFLKSIYQTMVDAPQHTFQLLTKRIERASDLVPKLLTDLFGNTLASNLSNVWLGTTVENQNNIKRLEVLADIPAQVRFASVEPMLSQITLGQKYNLDWLIIGCESGDHRRPCDLIWVREIVKECRELGIAPWVKQLNIDGKVIENIEQFPKDLQIREYPNLIKVSL